MSSSEDDVKIVSTDDDKVAKKKKKKEKKGKKRKRSASVDEEKRPKKEKKRFKKEKQKDAPEKDDPEEVANEEEKDNSDPFIVQSSTLEFSDNAEKTDTTLLLFYQYVDPAWDPDTYKNTLEYMQHLGDSLKLGGRMRVAKEGLNCTLTGKHASILAYCQALRDFGRGEFKTTEFKLTTDLPPSQAFPNVKIMPVTELVNYGLSGERAPPLGYSGTHLEPQDYHAKMQESDTVMIDVRNHYEAAIGHFAPPGAEWVDPKMRKSTEFPIWLDKEDTKEKLKGKCSCIVLEVCDVKERRPC
jgi:hypothetical protein